MGITNLVQEGDKLVHKLVIAFYCLIAVWTPNLCQAKLCQASIPLSAFPVDAGGRVRRHTLATEPSLDAHAVGTTLARQTTSHKTCEI